MAGYRDCKKFGPIAHLGERRTCNAEASGAEPDRSTKFGTGSSNVERLVEAQRVACSSHAQSTKIQRLAYRREAPLSGSGSGRFDSCGADGE